MIRLKRAYEPASPDDGERILVERLWPRGLSRERAGLSAWAKDIAPSPELRQWFSHDPAKWDEFRRRYWAELDAKPAVVGDLRERSKRTTVTLIYAARDEEHNSALALKQYLER